MRTTRTLMLSLLAVFAFSAVAATGAQADPWWIVPCHKVTVAKTGEWKNSTCTEAEVNGEYTKKLLKGETRNIAKIAGISPVQKLKTKAVTIECPSIGVKAGATNQIIGGWPGTDAATLVFTGCHPAGLKVTECEATSIKPLKATNSGEIWVAVKTLLGFAEEKAGALPIYEQFFPEPGPELFVELELSGTKCGLLPKTVAVNATGSTAPSPVGFGTSKCGVIGEVGKIKAGVFEPAVSGALYTLGGLNLPETAITKEEVYNSETGKYVKITCTLVANKEAATQSGVVSVELEGMEEFGVEI